ncbi:uncharacterized protein [Littorina saxatilis]|uniref:Uncharacterized protein n=1 Tax=Littorina saxatilis TaxID=31220 RepID=A0AAN9GHG7_9CAEN
MLITKTLKVQWNELSVEVLQPGFHISMVVFVDSPLTTAFTETPAVGDDSASFIIAAVLLASMLVCVILFVLAYFYCGRRCIPDCCHLVCPCLKRRRENIEMGYLPANITVNSTALEQGVPDIFLRHSTSDRISMDPASFEISRDSISGVETSGAWSDYLRRATLRRSSLGSRLMERLKNDREDNEETGDGATVSQENSNSGFSQSTLMS